MELTLGLCVSQLLHMLSAPPQWAVVHTVTVTPECVTCSVTRLSQSWSIVGDPLDTHRGVRGQMVSIATCQLHKLLPTHTSAALTFSKYWSASHSSYVALIFLEVFFQLLFVLHSQTLTVVATVTAVCDKHVQQTAAIKPELLESVQEVKNLIQNLNAISKTNDQK